MGTLGGAKRLDTGGVGDVVNPAGRWETLTKSYEHRVLLSEATAQNAGLVGFEPVGEAQLEGKRESLQIFTIS